MIRSACWQLALLAGLTVTCSDVLAQTDDDPPTRPVRPSAPARPTAEDEALWKRLDTTEDGWLDGNELNGGWKRFDADGDGEVTRAEFMAGRARERGKAVGSPEEEAKLFRKLDASGNGYLSGTELNAANARSYDANADNVVTLEEFLAGRARERGNGAPPSPTPKPAGAQAAPAAAQKAPAAAPKVPSVPLGKVEQPPAASMAGGKPVGLFFMTRFWSFTGTLEKVVWYFAPDGRVYHNLDTGFSAADLAAHKGKRGTYRVAGDSMEITWSDGKTTKSELERDGTGFAWDAGIFTPVQPFKEVRALAGTYEGGETLSVGGSHAGVTKTLQLRPDGTFTWDGVGFVRTTTSDSTVAGGAQGGTTGTWKVTGYSLLLTDSNGTVLRRIAFPYDDAKTPVYPDRLFFGGTMYKRR